MSGLDVPTVDADHMAASASTATLLDVREVEEWVHGHVAGSVNIPLTDLAYRAKEIDRSRPVIVICRSGNRSAVATQMLRSLGFEAYNMRGGVIEWSTRGRTLASTTGRPGVVA